MVKTAWHVGVRARFPLGDTMDALLQDLRFGLRLLWKDKGFTLAAVLTLAVCLGANAALFTVVDSVLLRPLAFPHPEQLVYVYDSFPGAGIPRAGASVLDYLDRVKGVPAFSQSALWTNHSLSLNAGNRPQQVTVMEVTPSFFPLLQASPLLGRAFTESEGEVGHEHAVILSYATWQQLYGGRRDALGQDLRVNDVPYTIVGVMPRGFTFDDPDVRAWIPAAFTDAEKSEDARFDENYDFIGRLKAGATLAQARTQLAALDRENYQRFPQWQHILKDTGFHTEAVGLQSDLVRNVKAMLYLLWGGALFVLLIGAVNVANLALVRSRVRLRELATRAALGADRLRLARQLITESVVVAVAGGGLGLLVGYGALRGFSLLNLRDLPRGSEIQMTGAVVAFVLGLAALVGVLIALVPVASVLRADLAAVFHEDARTGTAGRRAQVVRRTLVIAQVGLAFVLLFGAGLLLASFQKVLAVDPGFDPQHVLTASVRMPDARYPNGTALAQFSKRALDAIRTLPGVVSAGATTNVPLGGNYSSSVILAEGHQTQPGESIVSPYYASVSPGYFQSMGIALLKGRLFDDHDTADAPKVAIVDEELARHFWGDRDPIGLRLYKPSSMQDPMAITPKTKFYTVVGVVRHVAVRGVARGDKTVGAYYYPLDQDPAHRITFTIRTAGDPSSLIGGLRAKIAALDSELPVYDVETMTQRTDKALVTRRSPLVLSIGFGAVALFLAAIGIYGVLAYLVTQRRKEIGIRIALGSTSGQIFQLILREGVVVLAVGFVAGLLGALAVSRGLTSQLYQVQPANPVVLAGVTAVLAAVALVACLVPAGRATRVDPVVALRQE
ncbi:MAG: ABC transporter permease [Acidobacteriota bacterium]|nr:ABC transporter permease [Acidobacteriota bacterium]